jgi:D-alanyl-D-alanine carboxypeptidase
MFILKKPNIFFFIFFCFAFLVSIFFMNSNSHNLEAVSSVQASFISEDSLFRPLKKNNAPDLQISATQALSVLIIPETGTEKILFQKNANNTDPIASMSKLMTAIIVIEQYDLEKKIFLTPDQASALIATGGNVSSGQAISIKNLLTIMLIESNNVAADILSEQMPTGKFVSLMNQKAKDLNLKKAVFFNPSGLTEQDFKMNQASADDLKKIIIYIIKNHSLLVEICSIQSIDYYINGHYYKKLENTNALLKKGPEYLWGKTGYTKEANGCIISVSKKPFFSPFQSKTAYIINIIMGADGKTSRFVEAEKLENWITNSFIW